MSTQSVNCWNCGGRVAMDVCLTCGYHLGDDPLVGLELGGYRITAHLQTEADCGIYAVADARGPLEGRVLRVLPRGLWSDGPARDRFVEAGRRHALLDSPNVSRCLGHGSDLAGPAWHVLEWLAGTDLAAFVRRGRMSPLELERVLAISEQLAAALRVLHKEGIAHGRIAPTAFRNLSTFSDASDWVQLAHVGGAAPFASPTTDRLPDSPSWVGADVWSAFQPEDEAVGPAADVYGVGMVIVHLATGRALPRRGTLDELMTMLVQRRPGMKDQPALRDLLERALAPNPRDRFIDGVALHEAAERAMREPSRPLFVRPNKRAQPGEPGSGSALAAPRRRDGSDPSVPHRDKVQPGVSPGLASPARGGAAARRSSASRSAARRISEVAPVEQVAQAVVGPPPEPESDPAYDRPLLVLREMLDPLSDAFLGWARQQDRREALRPRSFGESPPPARESDMMFGERSRPPAAAVDGAPVQTPVAAPATTGRGVFWVAVAVASPFLKLHGRKLSRESRMEASLEPLGKTAMQMVRNRDGLITYLLEPDQSVASSVGRVLSFLMEFERTQRVAAPAVAFASTESGSNDPSDPEVIGELVARAERLVQRARGGEVVASAAVVQRANIESVFSPMPRPRQTPDDVDVRVWTFASRST